MHILDVSVQFREFLLSLLEKLCILEIQGEFQGEFHQEFHTLDVSGVSTLF